MFIFLFPRFCIRDWFQFGEESITIDDEEDANMLLSVEAFLNTVLMLLTHHVYTGIENIYVNVNFLIFREYFLQVYLWKERDTLSSFYKNNYVVKKLQWIIWYSCTKVYTGMLFRLLLVCFVFCFHLGMKGVLYPWKYLRVLGLSCLCAGCVITGLLYKTIFCTNIIF